MKQKTGTLLFVLAFILLWACTPSSLFKEKSQAVKTPVAVTNTETAVADTIEEILHDSITPQPVENEAIDSDTATIDTVAAALTTALPSDSVLTQPQDTTLFDSLLLDPTRPAQAALKRDTTLMDSLELAIYKYNKIIDDSPGAGHL